MTFAARHVHLHTHATRTSWSDLALTARAKVKNTFTVSVSIPFLNSLSKQVSRSKAHHRRRYVGQHFRGPPKGRHQPCMRHHTSHCSHGRCQKDRLRAWNAYVAMSLGWFLVCLLAIWSRWCRIMCRSFGCLMVVTMLFCRDCSAWPMMKWPLHVPLPTCLQPSAVRFRLYAWPCWSIPSYFSANRPRVCGPLIPGCSHVRCWQAPGLVQRLKWKPSCNFAFLK